MLKRTMPLLMIIAVLSAILAACGGGTTGTNPTAAVPENPTAAPANPTAAPAEPTAASAPTEAPAEPTAATQTGQDGDFLVVSREQQASWVRNFNPFLNDVRFPTKGGVYETLLVYNTMKAEYVPWLGTEYNWSDENKKLTFTTREGVNWSDGQPFTAKDVAFTFNLMKEFPALDLRSIWTYIDSVSAVDDKTVEFNFKRAFTPALFYIGHQPIVAEHAWKDVADPVTYTNENPVATGPFTEIKTFQNQVYELGRNPNYWQEGKPYIAGLRFPAFPSNDAANLAMVNGEADWSGNFIPDIQKVYVDKDPEHNHYWFPAVGNTVMLYLNTTKKPFDDPNVRKALSMAIDRKQIVNVAMFDYTHPADATGLSDAYDTWRSSDAVAAGTWVNMDVAKANEMLDAAGLKKGADGIRTMADGTPLKYDLLVVTGWSDWVASCQIMAQNLKELGLDVSVQTFDFSAWFDKVQKGEFDMSIGWSVGGPTPYNYYRGQMASETAKPIGEISGENWHRYANPDVDTILQKFEATADEKEQADLANQLQMIFVENAPAIPLFPGPSWGSYHTSRFTGFPDKDNPYAKLTPNDDPEQLLVLTEVKPAQ